MNNKLFNHWLDTFAEIPKGHKKIKIIFFYVITIEKHHYITYCNHAPNK
jgi:hypothetical protein